MATDNFNQYNPEIPVNQESLTNRALEMAASAQVETAYHSESSAPVERSPVSPEIAATAEMTETAAMPEMTGVAPSEIIPPPAPSENELEIKQFTENTQKKTLSPIQRRMKDSGYPFVDFSEAKHASGGSVRQATTWAGLAAMRQHERERLLIRQGVTSEYLQAA